MIELRIKFDVLFSSRRIEFPMNTLEPSAQNHAVNAHTEQSVTDYASDPVSEEHNPGTSFFVIGGVINITMILAYFVWAFGAWKKVDKRKGR